jgi:hypothetical protein
MEPLLSVEDFKVPDEELCYEPVTEEMREQDLLSRVKLPLVMKNKVILSPGIWNNFYYSPPEILWAVKNSDWNDPKVRGLFLDHEDESTAKWVGEMENLRMDGENAVGDLIVVDPATAIKLAYGAKFALSPSLKGEKSPDGKIEHFRFRNVGIVIDPACKTTFLNRNEKGEVELMEFEDNLNDAGVSAVAPAPQAVSTPPVIDVAKLQSDIVGAVMKQLGEAKAKEEELAKKKADEETAMKCKPPEEVMAEKTYPYPYEGKGKKLSEMTSEELAEVAELSAYTDFVKKYLEKNAGSTFKDAAEAWKKGEKMTEEPKGETKAPERLAEKNPGTTVQLSSDELDKSMFRLMGGVQDRAHFSKR